MWRIARGPFAFDRRVPRESDRPERVLGMPSRAKLFAVAAIISVGVGGAWWFRQPNAPANGAAPTSQALERRSTETTAPPPLGGQLLGHIETEPDGSAAGDALPTLAPLGGEADPSPPGSTGRIVPFPARENSANAVASPVPAVQASMPTESPWSAGGPAPIDHREGNSAAPPSRPRPAFKRHRIVDGDTLSSLAQHYLKDPARWVEIYQMNQDQLRDPDVLPIGARIKIPEQPMAASYPPAQPAGAGVPADLASERFSRVGVAESAPNIAPMVPLQPGAYGIARERAGSTYRVQPRDTLVEIARQLYGDGTRFREIYEANRDRIPDPNNLQAGVLLVIP